VIINRTKKKEKKAGLRSAVHLVDGKKKVNKYIRYYTVSGSIFEMPDMISEILHITRAGKTLVKKNLMDMLSKNGFPKEDLSVDQVSCFDMFSFFENPDV